MLAGPVRARGPSGERAQTFLSVCLCVVVVVCVCAARRVMRSLPPSSAGPGGCSRRTPQRHVREINRLSGSFRGPTGRELRSRRPHRCLRLSLLARFGKRVSTQTLSPLRNEAVAAGKEKRLMYSSRRLDGLQGPKMT